MRFEVPVSLRDPSRVVVELTRRTDYTSFFEIFVDGVYDQLLGEVRPGDVVVDAGAMVGLFTLLASRRVGPNGSVIAIEPNPENFRRLRRHLELNHVSNVHPLQQAVDAAPGRIVRMEGEAIRAKVSDRGTVEVPTTSIDEVSRTSGVWPQHLKMDIEGSEVQAADGMTETLPHLRSVAIELHTPKAVDVMTNVLRDFERVEVRRAGAPAYLRWGLRHPWLSLRLEAHDHLAAIRSTVRHRLSRGGKPSGFPLEWVALRPHPQPSSQP